MERRLARNAPHIPRELGITRWQDVIFFRTMAEGDARANAAAEAETNAVAAVRETIYAFIYRAARTGSVVISRDVTNAAARADRGLREIP